jgi:enterochelin esterase-like enzyme
VSERATVTRLLCAVALLLALSLGAFAQEEKAMSPEEIVAAISAHPTGAEADALAVRLKAAFGEQALRKGLHRRSVLTVAWLMESDGEVAPVAVELGQWKGRHHEDGEPLLEATRRERHQLARLGTSNVWAAAAAIPNWTAVKYEWQVGDRRVEGDWFGADYFPRHPDSLPVEGVPKGAVTKHRWKSAMLAGTERDYWVYVPAQYRPEQPACVMVFQDGGMYLDANVPTVFDNLIARGEMPVTVGVFVSAGWIPDEAGKGRDIRIEEYHDQSDQYARFLSEELLPEIEKAVALRHDAAGRAICGISSGAVCAFTAAWQRPDLFSKVICHVGSFVNIRGTYSYPFQIREQARKPLRIWLEDVAQDLDDICGSWVLANQQMAAALQFRGYDYHYDVGPGFHGLEHGAATLPEALRWVWRGTKTNADGR